MKDNFALIRVRQDAIDIVPRDRRVRAAMEPFRLGIEWGDEFWTTVIVGEFARADRSTVAIEAPLVFRAGESTVGEIRFRELEQHTGHCSYVVTCRNPDGSEGSAMFYVQLLGIDGEGRFA